MPGFPFQFFVLIQAIDSCNFNKLIFLKMEFYFLIRKMGKLNIIPWEVFQFPWCSIDAELPALFFKFPGYFQKSGKISMIGLPANDECIAEIMPPPEYGPECKNVIF